MTAKTTYLPRYKGPTNLTSRLQTIDVEATAPKHNVFISAAKRAKLLPNNNKSYKGNAKATRQGADAGGIDKPATGRNNDTTPNQKSSDDPAQLQGGASRMRNGGPDMADDTRTFGAHEGHHRIGDGDHQGRTVPHHPSGKRFEEGTQKSARTIGETNDRPRHPFRTRGSDDTALGGELVQDHLRGPEHAGVQLSFWPSDLHNDGGAQSGQGQRVIAGRAGIGGASRPRNNGTLHSGRSHHPAATGQSHLTLPSVNLQGA
jgi:hypothetical protein